MDAHDLKADQFGFTSATTERLNTWEIQQI